MTLNAKGLLRKKHFAEKDISTAFGSIGYETLEEVGSLISIFRYLTSPKKGLLCCYRNGSTTASFNRGRVSLF